MVTYPYAYMTYIVSPLAGLGGRHIVAAARLQLVIFICVLQHIRYDEDLGGIAKLMSFTQHGINYIE